MIQNPTILKKLEEKTEQDAVMRDFIRDVMNNESEGKQFSKFYKKMMAKSVNARKGNGWISNED